LQQARIAIMRRRAGDFSRGNDQPAVKKVIIVLISPVQMAAAEGDRHERPRIDPGLFGVTWLSIR